jgi:hypothetical protein
MASCFFDNSADKKKILDELITKQLKNAPIERKLHNKDLRRIVKYINSSIFDEEKCCMWNGYVTNETNSKRGTYVNFFFRNKKVALHRLLFENFVGSLGEDYYLKFSCSDNLPDGKCCNVNHMIKYKYNNIQKNEENEENEENVEKKNTEKKNNNNNNDNNNLEKKDNDLIKKKKVSRRKSRDFLNNNLKISFD